MAFLNDISGLVRNSYFIPAVVSVVVILLLAWNVILFLRIKKMEKKSEEYFSGSGVKNLEELILGQVKTVKLLDKDIQELYNISNKINNLALRGLYKTGLIRFNPFKDIGGDQSFSIAFLNGKNNGLTISSLHTREGTRIYAKSILEGHSEKHPLTEEEKEAIKQAMESKTTKTSNKNNKDK